MCTDDACVYMYEVECWYCAVFLQPRRGLGMTAMASKD